jgi:hypothetical protein
VLPRADDNETIHGTLQQLARERGPLPEKLAP